MTLLTSCKIKETIFFLFVLSLGGFRGALLNGLEHLGNKEPRTNADIDNVSLEATRIRCEISAQSSRLQLSIAKCPWGSPLKSDSAMELYTVQGL